MEARARGRRRTRRARARATSARATRLEWACAWILHRLPETAIPGRAGAILIDRAAPVVTGWYRTWEHRVTAARRLRSHARNPASPRPGARFRTSRRSCAAG